MSSNRRRKAASNNFPFLGFSELKPDIANYVKELYEFKNNPFIQKCLENEFRRLCQYKKRKEITKMIELGIIKQELIDEIVAKRMNSVIFIFLDCKVLDINRKYNYGQTLLFNIDSNDREELINRGIDLNLTDNFGDTAFMQFVTCHVNHLNIIKFMVEKGQDIFIRNKYGKSALDIAFSRIRDEDFDFYHNNSEQKCLIEVYEYLKITTFNQLKSLFLEHTNLFKELIEIVIHFYV